MVWGGRGRSRELSLRGRARRNEVIDEQIRNDQRDDERSEEEQRCQVIGVRRCYAKGC